jgi:hypothetical protein
VAEPDYGYGEVVRFLWALYGEANARSAVPQVVPFDRYAEYALGYALPTLWRELPRDGEDCGGFLTGNLEYLQRGVAAMRAPLALMYIPENKAVSSVYDQGPLGYADECYAHRGRDARLGPSCFDFSIGYALGAFNELWPRLGSAYLDLAAGRGVGIDGCVVKAVRSRGRRVDVELDDQVSAGRALTLRMGSPDRASLTLRINGRRGRTYGAPDVRRGIPVVP